MKNPELIVVIHLTASAIHTVIGQIHSPQDIRIIGLGSAKNHDFSQGVIRHRERLKSAIKKSIQDAEDMANCRVNSVWLSFSTPDLQSVNSGGEVKIVNEQVQAKDIVAALTHAKKKHIPDDMYLMHYAQQGIALDGDGDMVDDAIGMQANELMVLYHLMMMPVRGRQNLQQLLQECDVSIDQMLFDAVSSAEYGLLPEEKYHGVCLIDIGASTTSICVYREDKLVYTRCFAEGGHHVTLDLAVSLDVTVAEAEALKKQHANVDRLGIDATQFLSVKRSQYNDEKTINMQELLDITEARYVSILTAIKTDLDAAGLSEFLQQGYVITGGGAEMRGLLPLAKRLFANKVHKVNLHSAITAYTPYGEDDNKLRNLATLITQRKYQTAFGTLLYSQSDAFMHSEKSSPDSLQHLSMRQKFNNVGKILRKFF